MIDELQWTNCLWTRMKWNELWNSWEVGELGPSRENLDGPDMTSTTKGAGE